MSSTIQRTPKSGGRKSLFFQDLATPVSSRKSSGKFATPGQAAAVSALWRENFANTDLPPPPAFTLEDRSDFSPESGISDYPVSPELKSDQRTPVQSFGREFSTPKSKSEASTSYAVTSKQQQSQQSPLPSLTWWSPGKTGSSSEQHDKGKGSPVEGMVQPGALITLPPPREVARPEKKKNSVPLSTLDEEEWVTVYGFSPVDTNLVFREFEKCGTILKHVPGPREANWMHILYQIQTAEYIGFDNLLLKKRRKTDPGSNRADARKALSKNGMQINVVLIIGVKPVDPIQRQALNERLNTQGFMTLPPPSLSKTPDFRASPYSQNLQNGSSGNRQSSAGNVATPSKSVVSKIADLMFGV